MNRMFAGGIGVLAVVALGGCSLVANKQFRDEHTLENAITAITISGGAGSVKITGSSDSSIHVKRHVRYRDNKPGATDRVVGDTLNLDTDCGRVCWVDYDVTAPRGVRVAGRTGSGDITLNSIATASLQVGSGNIRIRGASGDVAVRSGSGDLDLSDVAGDVVCRTSSGNVRLTGITGAAAAETGSGDITAADLHGPRASTHTGSGNTTLRLATAQDVDADTGSGDVEITVPGGQSYRVTANTSSGDRHINVPTDSSADHQLKLHTGSGNITVSSE
jgi:hypothetical protein